jgi:hypothetical protein
MCSGESGSEDQFVCQMLIPGNNGDSRMEWSCFDT